MLPKQSGDRRETFVSYGALILEGCNYSVNDDAVGCSDTANEQEGQQ
jgi:hypothetical protein